MPTIRGRSNSLSSLTARANSSMSPITGTPTSCAMRTKRCGSGKRNGMPGDRISAAKFCQSRRLRSTSGTPAASAALRAASLSSQAHTRAPPAIRALHVAMPDRPRPKTATSFPSNVRTGIKLASPQLQRGEARKREQEGDDPEADHDGGLGPAELLEMVVDRSNQEDT